MSWRYPLMRHLESHYREARLRDVLLIACQHLLGSQYRMFSGLLNMGLPPENCIIVGKNYSTNTRVFNWLRRDGAIHNRRVTVAPFSATFEPNQPFDSWFARELTEFVGNELAQRQLKNYRHIIVLDDGGHLNMLCKSLLAKCPNAYGIEQTSSGERQLREVDMPYDWLSIARWYTKQLLEAPLIGEHAAHRITSHLTQRSKNNPRILAMGLGTIGRQTAARLTVNGVGSVFACDPKADLGGEVLYNGAMNVFRCHGGQLLSCADALESIGTFDAIIGATGTPALNESTIERLHPEVSLISLSSSDREFPAVAFRKNKPGTVHDDYWLEQRCLVNGGFPITFDGKYYAIPPDKIELTIASLQLVILNTITEGEFCSDLSIMRGRLENMWSRHQP